MERAQYNIVNREKQRKSHVQKQIPRRFAPRNDNHRGRQQIPLATTFARSAIELRALLQFELTNSRFLVRAYGMMVSWPSVKANARAILISLRSSSWMSPLVRLMPQTIHMSEKMQCFLGPVLSAERKAVPLEQRLCHRNSEANLRVRRSWLGGRGASLALRCLWACSNLP
jgi:hypothetical protein